jgi:protein-tyrosine phosphatase
LKSILFVCLGNICRSPLAEGIAKKIALNHKLKLHIDSAGTGHWHVGETPCENSIKVAKNSGVDISSLRAREIQKEDKTTFDYVVVMDKNNYHDLKVLGFENLYKIGDYGGFDGACVPDPYFYSGFEGFDKVYNMLDIAILDFLKTEGLLK